MQSFYQRRPTVKKNFKHLDDDEDSKYEPNDSLNDDNMDDDVAVSRKHSKGKKSHESSSTVITKSRAQKCFYSTQSHFRQAKKLQGYSTYYICEDSTFKDELKRKEQTNSDGASIQKRDVTVTTDQNNPFEGD